MPIYVDETGNEAEWTHSPVAPAHDGYVTGGPKAILRVEGLFILVISCLAYAHLGGGIWLFLILFLVPDISMIAYVIGPKPGAIFYNVTHNLISPAILGYYGFWSEDMQLSLIALIWSAHVAFDRMLGYGLKYRTAFANTHLGQLHGWQN